MGPDAVHRNPAPVSDAAQPQGASPYVPLPGERYGLSLRYFRWGITRLLTQVDVRSLPSVAVASLYHQNRNSFKANIAGNNGENCARGVRPNGSKCNS